MGQVKKKAKKTTFDQNELKNNNIPQRIRSSIYFSFF